MSEGDEIFLSTLDGFAFGDEDEGCASGNFLHGADGQADACICSLGLHEFIHTCLTLDLHGEAVGADGTWCSSDVEFGAIEVLVDVFNLFDEEASTTTVLSTHTLPDAISLQ